MSDTLLFAFATVCIVAIVVSKLLTDRRKRAEEESILAAYATETENDDRVDDILRGCVLDLKRQRAGGYGPWLASLIDGPLFIQYDDRGRIQVKTLTRPITPGLALSAVHRTIAELSGGRFNLDALYRAASELANMMEGA